ncbi:MAG TPA: Calx-beta domain-containing protein, partial [Pyrinomonadaceae bacterium]|nr:Calx-beta domain-containing protein [Pyrinomonadaceae bacterium]
GPGKAVAGADYTTTNGSVVFSAGEVLKTISVPVLSDAETEPDETFLVNLTGAVGNYAAILDNQATGTITVNTPGAVLISELRTSGPGGPGDDFVEIHNNSATPVTVGPTAWALVASNNGCGGDPVIVGLIPNGTTIPARGHFLFTGSQFSLTGHPTGDGTTIGTGDAVLLADLGQDVNVGLFNVADILNLSSVAKLDGVGFGLNTANLCDLLREGTTLQNAMNSTSEYSFVRKMTNPGQIPVPTDANNNATDFVVVSTTHATAVGDNASPQLGAPGPEKRASPNGKTLTQIGAQLLDPAVASSSSPNRVRTGSGNSGTVSIRRTFTNNTGGPVTALRFHFYDITAGPAPVGTADIRATSSSDTVATVTGVGVVTVRGTVLETPPAQPNGGGLNSSMVPTNTPAQPLSTGQPLANGQSINLQFLFNIVQAGTFRVFVTVEALP